MLRLVFAFAILGLVAYALPWHDELSWTDENGVSQSFAGKIDGDWKEDRIRFRTDAELPEAWPADARAAASRGETFPVSRKTDPSAAGFDWQPSMLRLFGSIETRGLALGMALFVVASMFVVTRWWRLLAVAGCHTTWMNALRLTYLGLCFNLVMPGLTGGDLVKGVVAAKENPGRRADAVVSVVVDRIIGLSALAIIAVVVVLLSGDLFAELRNPLLVLLGAGAAFTALYAAKGLRKKIGLSALVDRLPLGDKLRSLDAAALLYLKHPMELGLAFLLSFVNHLVVVVATYVLGMALGVDRALAGLREFLALSPVANMISAIPVAPGGWGVGELAYRELFELVGVSAALGVAISVSFRLCNQVGLGALGSLFLLLPGVRAEVRDIDPPSEDSDTP